MKFEIAIKKSIVLGWSKFNTNIGASGREFKVKNCPRQNLQIAD